MINITRMLTVDEGLKNRVYKDTKGKNTVGIGFNMDDSSARAIWLHANVSESFNLVLQNQQALSTPSAWALLNKCVENAKTDLLLLFPAFDSYPNFVQLALLNLMYNMGRPTFSQFTTFISLIKHQNYSGAATDLAKTKWATQVPKRCMRVCALLKGDDSLYVLS